MKKLIDILKDDLTNYSDKIIFNNLYVENIKFYKKNKIVLINLFNDKVLPFDTFFNIKNKLENILGMNVDLNINSDEKKTDLQNINKYFLNIIDINAIYSSLKESILDINDDKLTICLNNKMPDGFLNSAKLYFENSFKKYGLILNIEYIYKQIDVSFNEKELTVSLPEFKNNQPSLQQNFRTKPKNLKLKDYRKIKLVNVESEDEQVQFDGKIINLEVKQLKSGKNLMTLLITDHEGAIYAKLFESSSMTLETMSQIKLNQSYTFYGNIILDTFSKDLSFNIRDLVVIEEEKIVDDFETKRVELHLHTTMSEMDGVSDVNDVISHVFNLGHDGVAITDHGSVQAFAKAHNKAMSLVKSNKDRKFKVLYGCEMYLVDEKLTIVRNPNDLKLLDQTFVVFDLETTGLSNYFDEIIEFGAVKIKNYAEIDRLQMFIKPKKSIPHFIESKTNITNDMVKNAKTFEEVVDEILNWISDSVLVAHNASFDYGFLNESLLKIGRKPLQNTVIDTLDLARAMHSDRRSYRLGNIARMYKITYDEDVAHRADYDAQVLSDVFLKMLNKVSEENVVTSNDLQNLQTENAFSKNRASHIVVMAKNQAGIKDLYELVSISNTQTLAVMGKGGDEYLSEPRIFKRLLNERRNNLLFGSACYNGEVFECASNKDQNSLEKAMEFYDYIEIQPLSNYQPLITNNAIQSEERLIEVLKRIINTAIKLNKIIVATGDVHYMNVEQKKFRDVYINSQGVGGVRHPLFIYNKDKRRKVKNPDQHFRTTNEMLESFKWLNDDKLAEMIVINNTRLIFDMIEETRPVPSETFPPEIEGSAEKLKNVCFETAHEIYGEKLPEIVLNRLNRELDSIISNGYAVVYYISHLLVKKSNEDGYLVGSRGSVGSSFVATMSKITEVNPLAPHYVCPNCKHSEFFLDGSVSSGFNLDDKECPHCKTIMKGNGHNIPFETFLGFNGDKVPDIDLNFSNEYQSKAHAFTKVVFGDDHVFRAGTIGTVAEKTAFGYVTGYLEEMGLESSVNKATKEYLASGCVGIKRTTGQHPGGIIVIPHNKEYSDFTPIQYPANEQTSEWRTTHFDFHDIHDNVLKFDLLGHIDPTAMKLLENISGLDVTTLPMNDEKVLSLFSSCDALNVDTRVYDEKTGALGLPEFGTRTTRRVLEETNPKTFGDLVIISGLTHGTDVWSNNAQLLVQNGIPLTDVIGCRDDIMTYLIEKGLESITAFTIMESVRKGKGLKSEWEEIMKANNVPDWYIDSCKKIKYMFPKAHACAYVIMALRIAWFKVYKPHYFYVSYLTLRCDAYEIETMTKGIVAIKERMNEIQEKSSPYASVKATNKERSLFDTLEICLELYARGYRIGNIDLYKSKATEFLVLDDDLKTIIPSFTTIDGLGVNVAKSIEDARKDGEFLSKEDLMNRTQLSSKLIEKLEKLGCLNGLQETNQLSLF